MHIHKAKADRSDLAKDLVHIYLLLGATAKGHAIFLTILYLIYTNDLN